MFYEKRIQRKVSRRRDQLNKLTNCISIMLTMNMLGLLNKKDYDAFRERVLRLFDSEL
jgi:hypothetical protein